MMYFHISYMIKDAFGDMQLGEGLWCVKRRTNLSEVRKELGKSMGAIKGDLVTILSLTPLTKRQYKFLSKP